LWFFFGFLALAKAKKSTQKKHLNRCFFGFWILEAKNKDPIFLASKIQKPKKHLAFAKAKKPKKATTKGPLAKLVGR
jgi:hypothetical protein